MIGKFGKLATVLGAVVLAGCSETSFKSAFDLGKPTPDETQVQQNQPLTMPPDLQLRAPGGGAPQNPQNPQTPQAAVANNGQRVTTQPPQYGSVPQNSAQPQYTPPPQPQQASLPPTSQPPASQPPTNRPTAPVEDIYARNGISRLRADGTPKSNAELLAELKALKQKRQRAANPNYGTIFNLPKAWRDSQ